METIYEVVRIKQVIKEVGAKEKFVIRLPQDAADVAAQFIEMMIVRCSL